MCISSWHGYVVYHDGFLGIVIVQFYEEPINSNKDLELGVHLKFIFYERVGGQSSKKFILFY